jgi:hypothetical protein
MLRVSPESRRDILTLDDIDFLEGVRPEEVADTGPVIRTTGDELRRLNGRHAGQKRPSPGRR